jgi:UDP-GlcNAc:undecaprenyl-phosphate GlcNAc-1-phosphate transferase
MQLEWYELLKVFFSFILAAVLSYYLTPKVRQAAIKFGIMDQPDGRLKKQEEPVAYLGGLSIFISLLATASLTYQFDTTALGILLGTSLIIVLGLVDDFGVLSPWVKLGGQVVAFWALIKAGIYIDISWLPVWANIGLTFVWILGITNAFNLIDVMDGLCSGVAFVAAVFLTAISFSNGNYIIAGFTVTLAGSLLGFLPFNFKPARIYLGDTGSMAIGFILAALTINEQYTINNFYMGVLTPVVILFIPIFETTFLTIVRILKGLHPLKGSPDHYSLRLKRLGFSVETIAVGSYFVAAMLGGAGLVMVYLPSPAPWYALIAVGVFAVICTFALLQKKAEVPRDGK